MLERSLDLSDLCLLPFLRTHFVLQFNVLLEKKISDFSRQFDDFEEFQIFEKTGKRISRPSSVNPNHS